MTTLLPIFHNGDLYELRLRGTIITSITRYSHDTRRAESLVWDDLEAQVKERVIKEVREMQNHEY